MTPRKDIEMRIVNFVIIAIYIVVDLIVARTVYLAWNDSANRNNTI